MDTGEDAGTCIGADNGACIGADTGATAGEMMQVASPSVWGTGCGRGFKVAFGPDAGIDGVQGECGCRETEICEVRGQHIWTVHVHLALAQRVDATFAARDAHAAIRGIAGRRSAGGRLRRGQDDSPTRDKEEPNPELLTTLHNRI